MSSGTTNNYKLMGFLEVLTIIFVVAKLTGYFQYSWWIVFSPVFVHIALVLAIIAMILFGALISAIVKNCRKK